MKNFHARDVISIQDFTRDELVSVLDRVDEWKKSPLQDCLRGKILGTCFFEPSTRTRLSFESAMRRMGGDVIGFADPVTTSVKKGETLHDTMKIMSAYADVLVIRHPLDGSARVAADAADVPVINAGDGANQHPTQTLLDLFTIRESQGRIDELHIALVGDLKYGRTTHSLALALSLFNVRLYFVSPPTLQIPSYVANIIKGRQIKFSFHDSLDDVRDRIDVLYMTRVQGERFSDKLEYERLKNSFTITPHTLSTMRSSLALLHPLPRVGEIEESVDALPQAWYFRQAANGLVVRQVLLGLVLGAL